MNDTTLHIEVLKIARDLLMDEYVELVNQLEQRWSAESALYWRAQQVIVDYPALPAPPSVDRILEKAEQLLTFFNGSSINWPPITPEPEPMPDPNPLSLNESNVQ